MTPMTAKMYPATTMTMTVSIYREYKVASIQAQRPGPQEAWIATWTRWPGYNAWLAACHSRFRGLFMTGFFSSKASSL